MPSAEDVGPEKWSGITVLFDDGDYSVISGMYQQRDSHLGELWNGQEGELGFPNVAVYPVWHIVPEFLEILRIPLKAISDSGLIPIAGSEVKPIVFGAKRRWRSYSA